MNFNFTKLAHRMTTAITLQMAYGDIPMYVSRYLVEANIRSRLLEVLRSR